MYQKILVFFFLLFTVSCATGGGYGGQPQGDGGLGFFNAMIQGGNASLQNSIQQQPVYQAPRQPICSMQFIGTRQYPVCY